MGVVLALSSPFACSADASPARASSGDCSFREFVASLWPAAQDRRISRETFDRAFAGVSFAPRIVTSAGRQAEFIRPIWDYIAAAAYPQRIERGRSEARETKNWLVKAQQTYGVDPGVIMGIWALETDFSASTGSENVVQALASLACAGIRGDYFREELLSALAIVEEGDIAPGAMRGSWAGAMGQTQFMPSSYLIYAVDFEGHGKRDIWMSAADAIGSTANFLAAKGWKADLPWGFEVRLPKDFVLTNADSSEPSPFASFAARGVTRVDGEPMPATGEGRLLMPAGLKGPIFLVTSNFEVIKAYNDSTSYALAVAMLGDAIELGRALAVDWPRRDRPLSESQVRRLQAKLKKMGYDPGEIDGMFGDRLSSAVRTYQEHAGLSADGYADLSLMKRIEAGK